MVGSGDFCNPLLGRPRGRNPTAFTVMTGVQRQVLTVLVGAHEVANKVLAEKNMTQMCEGFVPKFESP